MLDECLNNKTPIQDFFFFWGLSNSNDMLYNDVINEVQNSSLHERKDFF